MVHLRDFLRKNIHIKKKNHEVVKASKAGGTSCFFSFQRAVTYTDKACDKLDSSHPKFPTLSMMENT